QKEVKTAAVTGSLPFLTTPDTSGDRRICASRMFREGIMRKTKMRILCLILAAMLLTACGKGQGDGTPQVKAGKYEILCKEAWIQAAPQGAGTMVLALEFTNNSEENTTYSWGVGESCTQNDQILEPAALHSGEEAVKNRSETVAPGETISLQTAF